MQKPPSISLLSCEECLQTLRLRFRRCDDQEEIYEISLGNDIVLQNHTGLGDNKFDVNLVESLLREVLQVSPAMGIDTTSKIASPMKSTRLHFKNYSSISKDGDSLVDTRRLSEELMGLPPPPPPPAPFLTNNNNNEPPNININFAVEANAINNDANLPMSPPPPPPTLSVNINDMNMDQSNVERNIQIAEVQDNTFHAPENNHDIPQVAPPPVPTKCDDNLESLIIKTFLESDEFLGPNIRKMVKIEFVPTDIKDKEDVLRVFYSMLYCKKYLPRLDGILSNNDYLATLYCEYFDWNIEDFVLLDADSLEEFLGQTKKKIRVNRMLNEYKDTSNIGTNPFNDVFEAPSTDDVGVDYKRLVEDYSGNLQKESMNEEGILSATSETTTPAIYEGIDRSSLKIPNETSDYSNILQDSVVISECVTTSDSEYCDNDNILSGLGPPPMIPSNKQHVSLSSSSSTTDNLLTAIHATTRDLSLYSEWIAENESRLVCRHDHKDLCGHTIWRLVRYRRSHENDEASDIERRDILLHAGQCLTALRGVSLRGVDRDFQHTLLKKYLVLMESDDQKTDISKRYFDYVSPFYLSFEPVQQQQQSFGASWHYKVCSQGGEVAANSALIFQQLAVNTLCFPFEVFHSFYKSSICSKMRKKVDTIIKDYINCAWADTKDVKAFQTATSLYSFIESEMVKSGVFECNYSEKISNVMFPANLNDFNFHKYIAQTYSSGAISSTSLNVAKEVIHLIVMYNEIKVSSMQVLPHSNELLSGSATQNRTIHSFNKQDFQQMKEFISTNDVILRTLRNHIESIICKEIANFTREQLARVYMPANELDFYFEVEDRHLTFIETIVNVKNEISILNVFDQCCVIDERCKEQFGPDEVFLPPSFMESNEVKYFVGLIENSISKSFALKLSFLQFVTFVELGMKSDILPYFNNGTSKQSSVFRKSDFAFGTLNDTLSRSPMWRLVQRGFHKALQLDPPSLMLDKLMLSMRLMTQSLDAMCFRDDDWTRGFTCEVCGDAHFADFHGDCQSCRKDLVCDKLNVITMHKLDSITSSHLSIYGEMECFPLLARFISGASGSFVKQIVKENQNVAKAPDEIKNDENDNQDDNVDVLDNEIDEDEEKRVDPSSCQLSADELLPCVTWVLSRSAPPMALTRLWFLTEYRHPECLHGEEAFVLAQIQSAAEFLLNCGAKDLDLDDKQMRVRQWRFIANMKLRQKCIIGDLTWVKHWLKMGADVNSYSVDSKESALTLAIKFKHSAIITHLLNLPEINVNLGLEYRQNALFFAVKSGQLKTSLALLRKGANRYLVDDFGTTLVSLAKSLPMLDIYHVLTHDPKLVSYIDLIRENNFEGVKALLLQGVDVNQLFIVSNGDKKQECDGNICQVCCRSNLTYNAGDAVSMDPPSLQTDLPSCQCYQNEFDTVTPLMFASDQANVHIMRLLLHCPKIDVNLVDWKGETALFKCVKRCFEKRSYDYINAISMLLQCGAKKTYTYISRASGKKEEVNIRVWIEIELKVLVENESLSINSPENTIPFEVSAQSNRRFSLAGNEAESGDTENSLTPTDINLGRIQGFSITNSLSNNGTSSNISANSSTNASMIMGASDSASTSNSTTSYENYIASADTSKTSGKAFLKDKRDVAQELPSSTLSSFKFQSAMQSSGTSGDVITEIKETLSIYEYYDFVNRVKANPKDRYFLFEVFDLFCYDPTEKRVCDYCKELNYFAVKALLRQGAPTNENCPEFGFNGLIASVFRADYDTIELLLTSKDLQTECTPFFLSCDYSIYNNNNSTESRSSTTSEDFYDIYDDKTLDNIISISFVEMDNGNNKNHSKIPVTPPGVPNAPWAHPIVNNINPDHPGRSGMRALHYASQIGDKWSISRLLQALCDRSLKNDKCHTALDIACMNFGPDSDVAQIIKYDVTKVPLWLAARHGDWQVLKSLLNQGALVNSLYGLGQPLGVPTCMKQTPCFVIPCIHLNGSTSSKEGNLITNNASNNSFHRQQTHESIPDDQASALISACAFGQSDIIRRLLQFVPDIDIDLLNKAGYSALFYCAIRNDESNLIRLLHYGSNRWLRDTKGLTAADHALRAGNEAIHTLLFHDPAYIFVHDIIRYGSAGASDGANSQMNNDDSFRAVVAMFKQSVDPNLSRYCEVPSDILVPLMTLHEEHNASFKGNQLRSRQKRMSATKESILLSIRRNSIRKSLSGGSSGNLQQLNVVNNNVTNAAVSESNKRKTSMTRTSLTVSRKSLGNTSNDNLIGSSMTEKKEVAVDGPSPIVYQHYSFNGSHKFIPGETPLIVASLCNRLDIVQLLLRAPNIEVNLCDAQQWTALFHAAHKGHQDIVLLLLKNGANRRITDLLQRTPSEVAAKAGHAHVSHLIEADPSILSVHDMCELGKIQLVHALFRQGVPPLVRDPRAGKHKQTPLMAAASGCQTEMIRFLLRLEQVQKGLDLQDDVGRTALMRAARLGALDVTALLLNSGCDRNIKDNQGLTARDLASRHSFSVMVKFMGQNVIR